MDNKKNQVFSYAIVVIGLLPLLHWMFGHVHQDAWWDELISLKDYALVAFSTTTTSYPEPGNHIFFNLFDNLLSRIFGVRDFYEMLDHLWKLRLAQGILAIGTCVYAFLITKRFFSEKYASLVVILLASCIPFLNFSLQLRGYNMSMLFVTMVIYHGWSYLDSRKLPHLIMTGLTSFFLLYTIPSNVYFLFGLSVLTLVDWWMTFRADGQADEDKKSKKKKAKGPNLFSYPHLWLLAAIGIGAIATFGAYQPIMDELLDNRFVSKEPAEKAFVLTNIMPKVLSAFLSFRWLLFLPILGGLFFWITKKDLDFDRKKLAQISIAFLLPFIFLFAHGKVPFERTFIHLAPVFAILLAGISALFLEGIKVSETIKKVVIAVLTVYCIGNYVWQDTEISAHLDKNLERNKREQNIYNAFFLADNFQPHAAVKEFLALNDTNAAVMLVDELDRVSYLYYLEKYDVVSYAMIKIQPKKTETQGRTFTHVGMFQRSQGKGNKPAFQQVPANLDQKNKKINNYMLLTNIVSQIERGKNIYLFTGFPKKAEKAMSMFFKDRYTLNRLNEPGFANLYKLEPTQPLR